jgi:hypothetical protein
MIRTSFLLTFFALAPFSVGVSESRQDSAQLTQSQLRSLVREAIESKSTTWDAPSLRKSDVAMTFNIGGQKRQSAGPRKPLDYPIEAQFTVELIRQQLAPKYPEVKWNDALAEAEKVIDRELTRVQTLEGKPDEQRAALEKDDVEFQAIFRRALERVADGRRVDIAVPRAARRFSVTVKLVPEGGLVFYLPVLQYDILKAAGGLDDERNWNELANPPGSLAGKFYFRGRWGKDVRITGIVTISRDAEVTIRR